MSGGAEDCFCVWLQQRNVEYPEDNTIQSLTVAWMRCSRFQDQHESAVSHQTPASSSLAAVFFREGRNHDPACLVNAECWCPCRQVMAEDAADKPCIVHMYMLHLRAVAWFPYRGRAAHWRSHAYKFKTPQSLLELQSDTQRRKPSR